MTAQIFELLSVTNFAEIRTDRRAASVANAVLADLAIIQDRLIGYFHVDAGNPATDIELGAAGLLCALAERLEQAARLLVLREVGSSSLPQAIEVSGQRTNGSGAQRTR
jgi:hypothetical protein